MKNKINIIALILITSLVMVSCSKQRPVLRKGVYKVQDERDLKYKYLKVDDAMEDLGIQEEAAENLTRVGVLLPLTGNTKEVGISLKNSALLAQSEVGNDKLVLQFYDTKGTVEGAKEAINKATEQKINLIVGPLFSESVDAIKPKARSEDLNIITFSTNDEILEEGVYSIGLLIRQQVERIISYVKDNGRDRLAVLVPDNDTGMKIAKNAVIFGQKIGIKVVRIGFFEPKTNDFSKVVREITNYDVRSKRVEAERKKLKALGEDDEVVKVALNRLKKYDTFGGVDFDTVLIATHGSRLKSAASMFGYFDVFPKDVKFIGTSLWDDKNINSEKSLIGGWFPALSKDANISFMNKYSEVYGEKAPAIASLAYDAVALVSAINRDGDNDFSEEKITNENGYAGIDGIFRLLPDGRSQRGLAIFKVTEEGNIVIDDAPTSFNKSMYAELPEPDFSPKRKLFDLFNEDSIEGYNLLEEDAIETQSVESGVEKENEYDGYIRPWIFGKDKKLVEKEIYGRTFDDFEKPKEEDITEEEKENIEKIMNRIYRSVGIKKNADDSLVLPPKIEVQ